MNFINEDLKLAAKKGAIWLDSEYPDWVEKINFDQLDMGDCGECIIGQVIGDYNDLIGMEKSVPWAIEHGFDVGDIDLDKYDDLHQEYRDLETVWTDQVRERLG